MNNRNHKRTFTSEFKHEAARLVLNENYSLPEAAKAMGVAKTMAKWVTQVRKEGHGITPPGKQLPLSNSASKN